MVYLCKISNIESLVFNGKYLENSRNYNYKPEDETKKYIHDFLNDEYTLLVSTSKGNILRDYYSGELVEIYDTLEKGDHDEIDDEDLDKMSSYNLYKYYIENNLNVMPTLFVKKRNLEKFDPNVVDCLWLLPEKSDEVVISNYIKFLADNSKFEIFEYFNSDKKEASGNEIIAAQAEDIIYNLNHYGTRKPLNLLLKEDNK